MTCKLGDCRVWTLTNPINSTTPAVTLASEQTLTFDTSRLFGYSLLIFREATYTSIIMYWCFVWILNTFFGWWILKITSVAKYINIGFVHPLHNGGDTKPGTDLLNVTGHKKLLPIFVNKCFLVEAFVSRRTTCTKILRFFTDGAPQRHWYLLIKSTLTTQRSIYKCTQRWICHPLALGLGLRKATADPASGGQRRCYCCALALLVTWNSPALNPKFTDGQITKFQCHSGWWCNGQVECSYYKPLIMSKLIQKLKARMNSVYT